MHPRPTAPTSRPSAPRMRVGIAMETLPCREPADCPSRYRHRAAERLSRLGERRVDRQVNGAGFAEVVVSWRATETREKPGGAGGLELCAPARRSRTCCGSWRRGCSACWSGAMAASTPARTRSRRRCWRPRPSGRPKGCRPAHQPGQAADQGQRRRVPDAPASRTLPADGGGPPGAVPDLQRGLHRQLRVSRIASLVSSTRCRAGPELHDALPISPSSGRRSWSSGPALHRVELTSEAIRLTRQLHDRLPDDGEVAGLLALMLLTDVRRPARTRPDGALVPLAEQDRGRWDARAIAEGTGLITQTLASAPIGPYQLQAAIAAVHDEAGRFEDTDWPQILGLYDLLATIAPGPMVTLNRIVAVAMVHGPRAGLEQLTAAEADPALAGHHRLHAVRAHLLDLAGDRQAARVHYRLAARRTLSIPERHYLESRAAR